MLFVVAVLFVTIVQSTTLNPLRYNSRYCISRPHYLNFMGPMHQKWPEPITTKNNDKDDENENINIPYDIPNEIFKNVFSHNLHSKKFR